MEVNFNNLRKKSVNSYNLIVNTLNNYVDEDRGYIDEISIDSIQGDMDDLRYCLVTLICLEDKNEGIECPDIRVDQFNGEE